MFTSRDLFFHAVRRHAVPRQRRCAPRSVSPPALRPRSSCCCNSLSLSGARTSATATFRDEFYFLMCGRHLAWGYVDQGPIVALHGPHSANCSSVTPCSPSASSPALRRSRGRRTHRPSHLGPRRQSRPPRPRHAHPSAHPRLPRNRRHPLYPLPRTHVLDRHHPLHRPASKGGSPRILAWPAIGLLRRPRPAHQALDAFLPRRCCSLWPRLTPQRRLLLTPWLPRRRSDHPRAGNAPSSLWEVAHHWPTWEFLRNGQLESTKPSSSARSPSRCPDPASSTPFTPCSGSPAWSPASLANRLPNTCAGSASPISCSSHSCSGSTPRTTTSLPSTPCSTPPAPSPGRRRLATHSPAALHRLAALPVLETVLVLAGLLILPHWPRPILRPTTFARYTQTLHLVPSEPETYKASILCPVLCRPLRVGPTLSPSSSPATQSFPQPSASTSASITGNYGEAASLEFLGRKPTPRSRPSSPAITTIGSGACAAATATPSSPSSTTSRKTSGPRWTPSPSSAQ